MSKLKPCPSCPEGAAVLVKDFNNHTHEDYSQVVCSNPECILCESSIFYPDEETAIYWWNHRPIEDALTAQIQQLAAYALEMEAQLAEAKNIIDELVFAMSTWRPIETAPKDGTKLLLFGCYSTPVVFIGFWETMTKAPDRWRDTRFNGGVPRKPSHWMPLPEPPTSKTECEK